MRGDFDRRPVEGQADALAGCVKVLPRFAVDFHGV